MLTCTLFLVQNNFTLFDFNTSSKIYWKSHFTIVGDALTLKYTYIFAMIFQKHLLKDLEIHGLNPLEVEMSFMQISCIILKVNH